MSVNTEKQANYGTNEVRKSEAGQSSPSSASLRRCIATGETLHKDDLIRFALSPDHIITPDLSQKLPGRGLWVKSDKDALEYAIKHNKFSSAARAKAIVPENLIDTILSQVKERLLSQLAFANRSGELFAGVENALQTLREGQAGLYATASAPQSDARKRICDKNPDLPVIDCFTNQELGRVIGKENITHIVVKKGNICFKGVHLNQLYKQLGGKAIDHNG